MENKRVILDSNIFIAFYYKDDSSHQEAVFLMEQLVGSHIIVPYCVIQEVATVLAYKCGKKKSDAFLSDLKKSDDLILVDDNTEVEIDFYLKFSQKLSFTDIALIHLAERYDAILFTFDRQLLNLFKKFS